MVGSDDSSPFGANGQFSGAFAVCLGGTTMLGGGFKHVLFSPLFGEDSQFDEHIFEMGGEKPPTRMDLITSQVILENDHRILWLELVWLFSLGWNRLPDTCRGSSHGFSRPVDSWTAGWRGSMKILHGKLRYPPAKLPPQ